LSEILRMFDEIIKIIDEISRMLDEIIKMTVKISRMSYELLKNDRVIILRRQNLKNDRAL
jgi:hypothetical protein